MTVGEAVGMGVSTGAALGVVSALAAISHQGRLLSGVSVQPRSRREFTSVAQDFDPHTSVGSSGRKIGASPLPNANRTSGFVPPVTRSLPIVQHKEILSPIRQLQNEDSAPTIPTENSPISTRMPGLGSMRVIDNSLTNASEISEHLRDHSDNAVLIPEAPDALRESLRARNDIDIVEVRPAEPVEVHVAANTHTDILVLPRVTSRELTEEIAGYIQARKIYTLSAEQQISTANLRESGGIEIDADKLEETIDFLERNNYTISAHGGDHVPRLIGIPAYHSDGELLSVPRGKIVLFYRPPLGVRAIKYGIKRARGINFDGIEVVGFSRPVAVQAQAHLVSGFLRDNFGYAYSLDESMGVLKNEGVVPHHKVNIIPDFTPPTFGHMFDFLQTVKEASNNHQNVAVHCGFGGGRTGSILASLLLYKKLRESPLQPLETLASKNVDLPGGGEYVQAGKTTRFVADIVTELRKHEKEQIANSDENPFISVEIQKQLDALDLWNRMLTLAKYKKSGRNFTDEELRGYLTAEMGPDVPGTSNIITEVGKNGEGIDPLAFLIKQINEVLPEQI